MTHMFPNGGASSSSTSVSSQRSETDDDKMIAMVLEEEYAKLDGAMAKRLTNLTSIPHVPRINTYFPTYSDATMDHHRLHDRLNAYGLFEVRVSGDGNCQFRALSDQLYRSPEYHKHVRKEIVKQLKACNSLYEGHVPMKYKHYCKKMKKYALLWASFCLQSTSMKTVHACAFVFNYS
uniref:OTU domain-containing protein n=1 Tax=Triticum urartu TaxID=4572 RepID=A0A8R7PG26_TRIUA